MASALRCGYSWKYLNNPCVKAAGIAEFWGVRVQDVALKMTIISPEAARRRSLCDRLEASFMQEIALLKASPAAPAAAHFSTESATIEQFRFDPSLGGLNSLA